jgi:outer membrane protein assembly factor BamB
MPGYDCQKMNKLLINLIVTAAMTVVGFAEDVLTYHNDNSRTGVNPFDTALTVENVNPLTFGKKFDLPVDGQVYAQPLVVSNISIGGVLHSVLIVATEHDSVYAFDAFTGKQLWKKSILSAGEVPADSINCIDITPENGITSTPVIDRAVHQVFVLGMSRRLTGAYIERLHALDLSTGEDLMSAVISAQFPGSFPAPDVVAGKVQWKAVQQRQRPALLLLNGIIYTAYGSFCEANQGFYAGWVIAYDEKNLARVGVFNTNPTSAGKAPFAFLSNGSGGGIWTPGALSSDATHVFATTGNGPFDGLTTFGDTVIKLSSDCTLSDFCVPPEQIIDQIADLDIGSGGVVLISQNGLNLGVASGKSGVIYIFDTSNLKVRPIYQTVRSLVFPCKPNPGGILRGAPDGAIFGTPAYYNGALYYGPVGTPLVKLAFSNGKLVGFPAAVSINCFPFPGTTPSIANGVVFAIEHASGSTVLHAYDATDLHELYNSNENSTMEAGTKFAVPTIFDKMVYVGTDHHVSVFSLK